MTVADLQALLSDLSKFLRNTGAAKPAGELDEFTIQLKPFSSQRLKEFGISLQKINGNIPPSKSARAPRGKPDPAAIEAACNRVLDLYHRAVDPAVTAEQIEAALTVLEELDPALATWKMLAKKIGLEQNFGTVSPAKKAIRQRVVGRKGAADRVNA